MDGEEDGVNSPWQTSCYRQGNIYRDAPVDRFLGGGKEGGSHRSEVIRSDFMNSFMEN